MSTLEDKIKVLDILFDDNLTMQFSDVFSLYLSQSSLEDQVVLLKRLHTHYQHLEIEVNFLD